jgi:cysteinyl-tRNA synthetase
MPQATKDRVANIATRLQAYVANNDVEMIEKSKADLNKLGLSVRELHGGFLDGSLQIEHADADPETIKRLIAERNAARKAKDFKESDRIRDELAAMGVVLKDSKDGTTWEIAR